MRRISDQSGWGIDQNKFAVGKRGDPDGFFSRDGRTVTRVQPTMVGASKGIESSVFNHRDLPDMLVHCKVPSRRPLGLGYPAEQLQFSAELVECVHSTIWSSLTSSPA